MYFPVSQQQPSSLPSLFRGSTPPTFGLSFAFGRTQGGVAALAGRFLPRPHPPPKSVPAGGGRESRARAWRQETQAMPGDGRFKRMASSMNLTDIPQVVKDLRAAAYEEKERVVHLMDIVAVHQQQNQAALVQAGAIKPLIELCSSGNDGAQIHAASTLATIAAHSIPYQEQIIKGGAIQPLVNLLKQGSNEAMTYAAAAIASLSEQHKNQAPIIKAGAIHPLVRLVRGDATEASHVHAAEAMAHLATQNAAAQRTFHEAGAVPLLLELLHSGKSQTAAAMALAKLLSPEEAQGEANKEIQEEIARDGGIPPILALLSGMSTTSQVFAAECLANLARGNEPIQGAIAKAGGIGPILAMLPSKNKEAQAQGASALAQLAKAHHENQGSIARGGGIPLLVTLLLNVEMSVQAMGALALTEVCRGNPDNQTIAAESGCIAALVDQLKSSASTAGIDEVKAEAVGAIWVISESHPENKKAIAKAGGISPTVDLIAGGTSRANSHAASALASLGFDNVENQVQITKQLVGLLYSGTPEARQNASLLAWRLIEENPNSHQVRLTRGHALLLPLRD